MLPSAPSPRGFSASARLQSFVYAGRGIRTMLVSQHNAWVHAFATVLVVILGFSLRVQRGARDEVVR